MGATAIHAEGCDHGFTPINQPLMDEAIQLRIAKQFEPANGILDTPVLNETPIFCVLYERGRNLLNLKSYEDALKALRRAAIIATPEDHSKQAIYNIIGYTLIQEKKFDQAVLAFQAQVKNDQFTNLPVATQTKVFNNSGLAYLRLNQYENARENFMKAVANGSVLAKANLAIVDSLISVQTKGDADVPGIFSVSLHSQRGEKDLIDDIENFSQQLAVSSDELLIYQRTNDMLSVTYGENLSYAKAQEYQRTAIDHGFSSAQIVSTETWENKSVDTKYLKK
jgi:tetratricopeptide (TPR) repeat protein